jgi:hypothetical protein
MKDTKLYARIKAGDKVKYARDFCRSIGAYTGDIPFARGTVQRIERWDSGLEVAVVRWDQVDTGAAIELEGTSKVNTANLVLQGAIEPN